MSKLKRHHINEVMDMHNLTRGELGYSFVYYADDVDRVIAEMKKACNEKDEWCLHTLKENGHHKYKRCLAMAGRCRLRGRLLGACGLYEKELWALKWHRRWLEIADKFKEAK